MKIQIKVEDTLENTPFPALLISKDHRILMANKALCEFLGKSFEEIKGKFCYEVIHSLGKLPSFCPLCGVDSFALGEAGKFSLNCLYSKTIKFKKGFYSKEFFDPNLKKFLKVTLIPLYKEEEEEVFAYLHFIEDKTGEYTLREKISLIIELFQGIFFINDENFNLIYVNREFKRLFPLEEGDAKCYEILYSRALPCEGCPMNLPKEEGEDEVFLPKLGHYFKRIFKKFTSADGKVYKFTFYIDITEEIKRFEEAPIALAITTPEGEIIKFNLRAKELFDDIGQDLVNSLKASDFWVSPLEREKYLCELLKRGEVFDFEAKLKTAKGKPIYALLSSKIEKRKEKVLINTAITDVTQYLKKKEEAWKLLELITELLPFGVAMLDEEGICLFANKRLEDITGYTKEELIGSNLHQLLIAEEALKERAMKVFRDLKKGESRLASRKVEFLVKKKDGTTFLAEIYFEEVYIEGKRYFIGTIQDITERKRIEEQLFQREKELLIEKISAGLAHDLNNLLMVAKGYLELLEEKAKAYGEREIQYMLKVKEVYEKMQHLVLELFILSKGDIKKEEFIELSSFLKEWVSFLLRGTKIQVNFEKMEGNLYVPMQQSHLISLISNIVLNAKDAMDNLGELTVRLYREGELAVIEISDTGKGIPEELVDKIFEPGFSTKPHGSGLGLFVVKRILALYKGQIFCRSKLNEGTTFIIKLPLAELKVEVKEREAYLTKEGALRRKILVLDDERDIRELLEEVLTEKGYEVETFEEGDSAYESFIQALREGKPYQTLLLDLTVPKGKGGVYLLKKLKEAKVDLKKVKVLLMTGYTEKEVKEEASDVEFDGVLFKPFSIQKLLETLGN